ncbi:histidine phosphatase family protein [Sphingomonas bacterium]|uniref:histidine phosphatase family protein n=1 Tax=Sphingomonas bacterium TaxID=1895847 RepID=UPI001C2CD5D1|nr:histidine phosphatase family protein [Sphingomonas bacterium]
MAITLLLIRHAEHVDFNLRLSGRREGVALSEHGRDQAAALAERLATERIDRVEASPLDRTRATAEALGPVVVEPALIEIDMGEWTGRALDSFGDDQAWRAWNEHRGTARMPGGESMAEAQARIVAHIERTARTYDEQTIAMVSHSDMIRAAIAHALGLSLDNLLRFDIEPASVSRLVAGDWGMRVVSINEGVTHHG